VSSTLTEQDKFVQPRKAADYLPFPGATTTVAEYTGVSQVTASSSASDADAYLLRGAEYHPGAALDGNPDSAWLSGSRGKAVGQWWQAGFPKPVAVPSITLRLAGPEVVGATPARLRISTSAGSQTVSVADPGAAQTVTIGGPPVSFVRITVTGLAPDSNAAGLVGLREVVIKGVTPERFIRSAYLPTGEEATGPAAIVLDRQAGARRPCADLGKLVACSPYQERLGEEEGTFARRFATAHPGRFSLTVDVTARPGAKVSGEGPQPGAYSTRGSQSPLSEVDRYLAARLLPPGTTLTASSQLTSDPRSGAAALSDGDPATFWIAGPDDKTPSLTVSWPKPRPVSALKLDFPPYPAASLPFAVTVSSAAGTRTAKVDPRGNVKIPALTTNRITLTFPELYHAQTSDPLYGAQTPLPVGLTGISIPGVLTGKPAAKDPPATCGSGPDVTVDGHRVRTRMLTPIREVLAGRRLTALPCSGAQLLGAGMHELIARDAGPWRVQGAALTQGGWASGSSAALDPRPVTVGQWTATSRTLTAGRGGSTVVTVAENFNRGWRARFGGEDLAPIRIDGWRQGWIVPPGESGVITLTYTPQRPYAVGLAVGALGVLLVLLAAWWPSLRLRRASGPLGDPGGFAPLRARPVQGWHLALLGVPVLVLGGPWSLVIAAVCVAAGLGLRAARRSPPWPVVLEGSVAAVSVAMAALAAGALQGWAPWAPGIGLIPQVLGVTAVALTVTALAWELAGERPPADRGDSPVKRGAAGGEPAAVSAAAVEGAGPPEPVTDASS
jgi:arabinofuranan 3-O-arabinosyltransferase